MPTNKLINQTNQRYEKHNLLGGGKEKQTSKNKQLHGPHLLIGPLTTAQDQLK